MSTDRTRFSAAFPSTARITGSHRTLTILATVAVVAIIAVTAFLAWRGRVASAPPVTLAVLPFGNTAADSAKAPLADGFGDEVFSALGRVPGLQMRSRSGARAFRGSLAVDPVEAGRRLKVDYLVTGAMREARGHWIVSAELTRVADATEL
ncbi:MAG: hypothetical protein ABIT38_13340 [Gemmatimonadaceae bacterium]